MGLEERIELWHGGGRGVRQGVEDGDKVTENGRHEMQMKLRLTLTLALALTVVLPVSVSLSPSLSLSLSLSLSFAVGYVAYGSLLHFA